MRVVLAIALLAGCSFQPGMLVLDGPPADDADAPIDAPVDALVPPQCPDDSHLRLCFSFDQESLGTTLPNEGVAQVAATLTNVTRIAEGTGGAALHGATSTIFVPMSSAVTGIRTIEVRFRADEDAPTGGRAGLVDSNINPNISLFYYRNGSDYTLRCGLQENIVTWDAPPLAPGTWFHVICTCDAGTSKMFVDGVQIGATAGPCSEGGQLFADGITIGSNNNGGPNNAVNDRLIGAIDYVRLWDVTVTP